MALPGFDNKNNIEPVDLMVLGEVLVKHYLFLKQRDEKKDFFSEVYNRFYFNPAPMFMDQLETFKTIIKGNSTFYNDALLFVTAVVVDLVDAESYFDKMLKEYAKICKGIPSNEVLDVKIKSSDYFDCVFFSLRFFIDQLDLLAPLPEQQPEEKKDE